MRALAFLSMCLLLVACSRVGSTKSSPCPVAVAPAPAVLSVPQVRYVPIEAELTAPCSWVRDGALEDMPEVARGRKRCLQFYEANLREIGARQGSPFNAEGKP